MTRQQDKVEPVHSYDAFHTRHVGHGVNGIIGMHRFNICLVVVLFWCENTIRIFIKPGVKGAKMNVIYNKNVLRLENCVG